MKEKKGVSELGHTEQLTTGEKHIFLEVRTLLEQARVKLTEIPQRDLASSERELVEMALIEFVLAMQARGMQLKDITALLKKFR